MPLTPADVHNVAFKKPPIGKRGYDEEEVDAFLDIVEVELARLIEENNDLRNAGADANGRSGAPAEMHNLNAGISPSRALIAWKIAGTAGSTVARVAATPSRTARGSGSADATTATPWHSNGVTRLLNPYECEKATTP